MIRVIANWHRHPQRPKGPDQPRAFELAKLGLDWLDTLLGRISDAAKGFLLEQNLALYQLAADLALELGHVNQAYLILERSKSRVLVEQMLRERAEPSTHVQEHLRTQYQQLRTRLAELVNQLAMPTGGTGDGDTRFFAPMPTRSTERSAEQQAQLLQQQLVIEQQLDKVRRAIAEQDPAYGEAISPRPLTPKQLVGLVPANTLAIAFEQRPYYLLLYAITAQGVIQAPLPIALSQQQLTARVNTFQDHIKRGPAIEINKISDWITATLAPAVTELLNISPPPGDWQQILLIPHQAWHLLPLHLLKIDDAPLMQRYPVRYIPALQVLRLIQERQPAKPGNGCIIANPDGSLPAASAEGQTIKNHRPADALLEGQQAALQTVREQLDIAHHGHFACHGYFEPGLNAGLILADGRLQAKELFASLRLPEPRIVVLSACETAQIKPTLADEYMGLVSGFLFAGAHNVLATLWRVDDASTRLLMAEFYQGLAADLSPTLALQRAQQQLQEMPRATVQARLGPKKESLSKTPYQNPYHWAGFVLVGDGV
ncbi:MAG TPA: CHAT domain-containing protein [Thioploca sp.]|nr:CHAT domain-containing protein [Thioploca sp.]